MNEAHKAKRDLRNKVKLLEKEQENAANELTRALDDKKRADARVATARQSYEQACEIVRKASQASHATA